MWTFSLASSTFRLPKIIESETYMEGCSCTSPFHAMPAMPAMRNRPEIMKTPPPTKSISKPSRRSHKGMFSERTPPWLLLDLSFSGVSCFVLSLCWLLWRQVQQAPWLQKEGVISVHGLFPSFWWRVEEMQMLTAGFQSEHCAKSQRMHRGEQLLYRKLFL